MKKILYISASSKPEDMSTSKTAGRYFINKFKCEDPQVVVEELDLYSEDIKDPNYKCFKGTAELVDGEEYESLREEDKNLVDRMNELCNQFLSADIYVIAAPMWSVSFPSILKRYIDSIMLNNKLIELREESVKGLLDDKPRDMVYIQSSGGIYPKILGGKFNHGVDYFHDIFKFLGVKRFEKVLIEGVDMNKVGRDKALEIAYEDIDLVVKRFSKDAVFKI
ncbi:FMN-dependent NADH-azoreductase [Haloimpatiens sp. FM7315]|uniref:FMN-dependent NADH-azoreductase n=1 Tax=Haloimpatiens sp. FM7315 TaxID=3298609 RepID=UPI0035A3C92A